MKSECYICPYDSCEKRFAFKSHYTSYLAVHTDNFPFPCQKCAKKFRYKNSRDAHKKVCGVQENKLPLFCCETCSTTFTSSKSLKDHQKEAHGAKDLRCRCGATFAWRQSFNRHKKPVL